MVMWAQHIIKTNALYPPVASIIAILAESLLKIFIVKEQSVKHLSWDSGKFIIRHKRLSLSIDLSEVKIGLLIAEVQSLSCKNIEINK